MKELDPLVFVAVFQEMLGPLLWVMLLVAVVGTVAFLALLVRERGLVSRRLVLSEVLGIFGGGVALVTALIEKRVHGNIEPEPAPALDALLAAFQKAQVSSASYGESIKGDPAFIQKNPYPLGAPQLVMSDEDWLEFQAICSE